MLVDDFIGKDIKEYKILERIGQGGMATVYRAHQASVNRDVAIKIIRLDQEIARTNEFQQRFAQEAKLIAGLEHIHILPVYDYGVVDNIAYLAMRWLRGGALSASLRTGPLSLERATYIFHQVASGLAYAHSKGIIHRDLKTSNILLDDLGNAYLSDFGLAKILAGSVGLTQSGNIVGTPVYMAPEMLRGEAVDHRCDIYSLGMVLYHMLTGKLAYDTSAPLSTMIYQVLEKGPVLPTKANPNIPTAVEAVMMKALAKDPDKRYRTADEMAHQLSASMGRFDLDDLPTSHLRRTPPRYTTSSHTPRTPPTAYDPTTGASGTPISVYLPRRWHTFSLTFLSIAVLLVTLIVAYVALTAGNNDDDSPTVHPRVLANQTGHLEDTIPGESEIGRAQDALGDNGFIAYITCTQTTDYHAKQARELQEFAASYSLDYHVYDSNEDEYQQLTLIERARTDGAKGIVLCPLNAELLVDTLNAVQRARIPLVLFTSAMPGYGGVKVAGDDYEVGIMAGRTGGQIIVNEMNGQARVVILDYPDLPYLVRRADGLRDGLLQMAPRATVIGNYQGGTRENGFANIAALLTDGERFDMILSINDAGALGAVEALEDAGVSPDEVAIVSVDAEARAIEFIRSGFYFRASETVDRLAFSEAAINTMVRLLAGATLPETILVPPGEMITRDNLPSEDD